MGSYLSSYELLPLAFHHVVEHEVGRRVSWIEDGHVLVELRQSVAFGEIPLGVRSSGTYGVGAACPLTVVVEVHRTLGHQVGAVRQDL